jgi:MFS family permease
VLALVLGAREVRPSGRREMPRFILRSLGRPFLSFLLISGLFDLGNSSDAFLVLRAQERGLSVMHILAMLVSFNLIYALVSAPAGRLSDRLGRQALIVGGWLVYAAIYLGFALAQSGWHVWALYALYGLHYALALGASKALVADLVPENQRGAAYGTYHAFLGLLDLPASLIAGILWQGVGAWRGFGAPAPFLFGAATALLAATLMALWKPPKATGSPLNG